MFDTIMIRVQKRRGRACRAHHDEFNHAYQLLHLQYGYLA
jgi:hypothetical protein